MNRILKSIIPNGIRSYTGISWTNPSIQFEEYIFPTSGAGIIYYDDNVQIDYVLMPSGTTTGDSFPCVRVKKTSDPSNMHIVYIDEDNLSVFNIYTGKSFTTAGWYRIALSYYGSRGDYYSAHSYDGSLEIELLETGTIKNQKALSFILDHSFIIDGNYKPIQLSVGNKVCQSDITVFPYPIQSSVNVYPRTTAQTINPPSNASGYKTIYVNAVTSSIDANLLPGNIKKGVVILGVTGTYEGATGTVYQVTINPTYNAITVYDGTSTAGTNLGRISGTTTVDCTTGNLYLVGSCDYYSVNISNASGVEVESSGSGWTLLKVTADGSCSATNECIVEGSLVTLADGSTKPIEEITYDDELLTWNFDEGKLEARKPCWIMQPGTSPKYWHTVLSDGTEINLVGAKHNSHRFFNAEQGKFIYANNFDLGNEHTFKQDGSMPIVVSCEPMTDRTVKYYNMMTEHNIGFFANGILVGNRFSNMYPIKDMKFVKYDKSLNNREDYPEVPDRIFYGLRIAEQSEAQNANGSVQFYDTLREHIIHNIVEHDILYTGEKDYVPWKFKKIKVGDNK